MPDYKRVESLEDKDSIDFNFNIKSNQIFNK